MKSFPGTGAKTLRWFAMLAVSASATPAFAQLQLPNPLIRPALAAKPAAGQSQGQAQGQNSQTAGPNSLQAQPLTDMPSPYYGNGNGGGKSESSPAQDIKTRLATFYVSAIVGHKAILRKSSVVVPETGSANAAMGGNAAYAFQPPQPGMRQQGQGQTLPSTARSEALTLIDGEPIDFDGEGITLLPRVTPNRVYLYLQSDKQRRAVVFVGEVESMPLPPAAPIVLQTRDANYKQYISVEQKGGGMQGGGVTQPSAPTNVPPPYQQ